MMTGAEIKSVVLIANCRLLASVMESDDQSDGPSLHMVSMQRKMEGSKD